MASLYMCALTLYTNTSTYYPLVSSFFVRCSQQTSVDAVAGGLASNFFQFLAEEQSRIETIDRLQAGADLAVEERLKREAAATCRG